MSITLFGLFAVLGFIISGFFLWKRAIDEHLPESQVFDIYITASLWALIASRAVAILLRFDRFGFNPLRWFSLFSLPGLDGITALTVGVVMILLGATKRHWDPWLTLDVYVPSIMLWQASLIVLYWWQVTLFWLAWFMLLWWVEHEYRLWEWYRGRRGFARPGLVTAIWIGGIGSGFSLVAGLTGSMVFLLGSGIVLVLIGSILGYIRSGRVFKQDLRVLSERIGSIRKFFTRRRPRHVQ